VNDNRGKLPEIENMFILLQFFEEWKKIRIFLRIFCSQRRLNFPSLLPVFIKNRLRFKSSVIVRKSMTKTKDPKDSEKPRILVMPTNLPSSKLPKISLVAF
jgi:hypothetical protein